MPSVRQRLPAAQQSPQTCNSNSPSFISLKSPGKALYESLLTLVLSMRYPPADSARHIYRAQSQRPGVRQEASMLAAGWRLSSGRREMRLAAAASGPTHDPYYFQRAHNTSSPSFPPPRVASQVENGCKPICQVMDESDGLNNVGLQERSPAVKH